MGTETNHSDRINNDFNRKDLKIMNSNQEEVPKLPIEINENNVVDGAIEIIKAIRPHWSLDQVEFKMFTDGITNKLVGCFYKPNGAESNGFHANGDELSPSPSHNSSSSSSDNHSVNLNGNETTEAAATKAAAANVLLVRVYGNKTDMLIDRKAETRNIKLLHRYGFAPQLFGVFRNGLAYEYVPGGTLNPDTVIKPKIWKLIAQRMADMHRVNCDDRIPRIAMLPGTVERFLDLIPERFSDPAKHERLKDTFLPVEKLRAEFAGLFERLEKLNSPVVFAHNDLLLTNIIYTESLNRVTFIDFEYAAYNFQAFDIGNHFTEFAGVDEIDYSRYPSKEFQLNWLRTYLEAYHQTDEIAENDVERLYVQVNQFALASHYLWTVWALIQAEHSNIDFNYAQFAHMRYGEYLAKRDQFLSLEYKN